MASKFQQYKIETGTTPLASYVHTPLFEYTKALATRQGISHADWIRQAMTTELNRQVPGLNYIYPTKENQNDKIARLEAEVKALRAAAASATTEKKAHVPTPPTADGKMVTQVLDEPSDEDLEEIEDEEDEDN